MVALTLLLACLLVASDEEGERISGADVQEHVDVLASDLFEGREAGTVGEQRAAAYLVSVLEDMAGLEPGGTDGGWLQEFGIRRKRTSRNVLAVLPGSDEERRHETIVIGAHFDHEGAADLDEAEPLAAGTRRRVFNGADDNASGTAVLLELARVLASSADRPRRTIAFHWYGAEESGLLGSEHYTGHPTRRLSDTVFMLNLDMVGRLRDRTVQVQGTGSSPLLGELARAGCAEVGLALRDEPLVSSNSDQWSFFVHRVPVLHLFTGFHRDYHKPGDEAHKINAEGAAEVGRLALQILRGVDALERIPFSDVGERTERWWPRPDIGASLRHLPRRTLPGRLLVTAIEPGSPAADGGLLPGDVIVRIDGQSVLDEDGLAVHMDVDGFALREHRLEILRRRPDAPEGQGGMEPLESLTLSVRPELR